MRSDEYWVAYANDGSVFIPFQEEIQCLRVALARGLEAKCVKFGADLLDLAIVAAEIVEDEVAS